MIPSKVLSQRDCVAGVRVPLRCWFTHSLPSYTLFIGVVSSSIHISLFLRTCAPCFSLSVSCQVLVAASIVAFGPAVVLEYVPTKKVDVGDMTDAGSSAGRVSAKYSTSQHSTTVEYSSEWPYRIIVCSVSDTP